MEVASRLVCALTQDEINSLKSKLEECKGQLQSNEQMIRWLNNQVLARHNLTKRQQCIMQAWSFIVAKHALCHVTLRCKSPSMRSAMSP